MGRPRKKAPKTVETITHVEDTRTNIPTAEYEAVVDEADKASLPVAYARRNRDLDPQLIWRGKDEQDWSDLVVNAPPLYIQEKVHPKVLLDDLVRRSEKASPDPEEQIDLFADFNRLPEGADKTDFYEHEQGWTNRMILGDSLQVMASLAEREGLRGKVQCIYIDPPYGIEFNSNFQWSTTSRDVRDGNAAHITREPEQVKAFRDTWRDGIHSYLTYLRDRLTVARDLLCDSGSLFVQMGDGNLHRVRSLVDEIFGEDSFVSQISYRTTTGRSGLLLDNNLDYLLWYAKDPSRVKYRPILKPDNDKTFAYASDELGFSHDLNATADATPDGWSPYNLDNFTSQGESDEGSKPLTLHGEVIPCPRGRHWRVVGGRERLVKAERLEIYGNQVRCRIYSDDGTHKSIGNIWLDVLMGSFVRQKIFVVQTSKAVVERAVMMTTDPGDLVLDPTCGSGTSAYVAEQWGRRWITIDTSRVALALARARIMGARYPYYLLADSLDGQVKEAELAGGAPSSAPTHGDVRHGFVYRRSSRIMLKAIAENAEIDVIWERFEPNLESLRRRLNAAIGTDWQDWEVPREPAEDWSADAREIYQEYVEQRAVRQKEIDLSVARGADYEHLYDQPYEDGKKVRVAGPFTVESLSPHRVLGVDENDELVDPLQADALDADAEQTEFVLMILENLKAVRCSTGSHRKTRSTFASLTAMAW